MRDDGGTGPLTSGSGRMGSKDPVGISGCMSWSDQCCLSGGIGNDATTSPTTSAALNRPRMPSR
jgi:hypothetical protein